MSFERYKNICQRGPSHHGKQIMMICINSECDSKRLCCLTCIDQFHRKHELISLYKFDGMLEVLTQRIQPQVKNAILGCLREFQSNLNKSLQRSVQSYRSLILKYQKEIRSVVANIEESVSLDFTLQDVDQLYSHFTNAKVCQFLAFIKDAENQNFKNVENAAKALKAAQTSFEKQMFECEKQYLKGIEQVSKGINKLKQLIQSNGGGKKKVFSTIHKAASIKVSENLEQALRFQGAGGYPIVLVAEPLTQTNNSINVVVKEQPGNKGVWMGVCALDIVKNFNYASCYGMGKGAWAIDQVGASHASAYSWSHHDPNFNSQPKVGWQFNTGDIVNMRVDFGKSVIIFSKEQQSLLFEMPIKTDLGDLYFFVGPTHLNDTICIV